jgi:hypothetical protein
MFYVQGEGLLSVTYSAWTLSEICRYSNYVQISINRCVTVLKKQLIFH